MISYQRKNEINKVFKKDNKHNSREFYETIKMVKID